MANESVVLWVDVENNALLTGWESNSIAQRPSFKQGDNIKVEMHFVRRVSTNTGIYYDEIPTAGSSIRLAVGNPDAIPTGGTWTLSFGGEQADFLYNASAASVETALNAFTSITALGGVTVEKVNGDTTYRISFNDKIALTDSFVGDATNLLPSSVIVSDEIKVGSATVRGVWQVKPTQVPIAYQGVWTAQTNAAITATLVQSGTTRVKIDPSPKDGTFTLSVGTYTTAPISVYATALDVQNAITAVVEGFEVQKSGAFIWDVSQTTTPLVSISADGSGLISFDSVVGEVNFNNYETATLLAGATSKNTTLEIEVTTGTSVATVLQTQCTIVANLINETIFAPTPFEEHLTPAEANALYLQKLNNLSDLANTATARTNLSVYSTLEADSLLALKADLTGATFTGKVTGTVSAEDAAFNIGTVTSNPTNLVNGDIWIADRLLIRNRNGATLTMLSTSQTNNIVTSSNIAFILGITQNGNGGGLKVINNGTGESLRIEDGSENPDLTPFIVGNDGRVGIHGSPAVNTAHKLAIYNGNVVFSAGYGIAFGDGTYLTSASGGQPSIKVLGDTDFGGSTASYAQDGDFVRWRTSGEYRYADVGSTYSWVFPYTIDGTQTSGSDITSNGSGSYEGEFGSISFTANYTISFSKHQPRLNTGTVEVIFDAVPSPSFTFSVPTKNVYGGTENYGDILTIVIPSDAEFMPSGSSVTYEDASQGISISFSIDTGGNSLPTDPPLYLNSGGWESVSHRYEVNSVRATHDDQFVTRAGVLDSFIQQLVYRNAFDFAYTGNTGTENWLLRWDITEARFKFVENTTLLANTAKTNTSNTFLATQVISVNTSTPALRVTQVGTGASLLVEDNTNPDNTAFVVNSNGAVGIQRPVGWSPSAGVFLDVNGKGVFTPTATYAGINIGTVTATPTSPVNGDIWIGNALNFRGSDGSNRTVPVLNTSNTFTAATTVNTLMTINQTGTVDALSVQTSNASNTAVTATFQQSGLGANVVIRSINTGGNQAALRVEQRGLGHALVVEDSQNPDTSATFINSSGRIGVNLDPATATLSNAVEVNGAVKADSITFDGTAQFKVDSVASHASGSNTHDLLVSYNGSTYRIPMIFVSTP